MENCSVIRQKKYMKHCGPYFPLPSKFCVVPLLRPRINKLFFSRYFHISPLQIDKRWHTPRGDWNSREHIRQATNILRDFIISSENPFSNSDQRLKGELSNLYH